MTRDRINEIAAEAALALDNATYPSEPVAARKVTAQALAPYLERVAREQVEEAALAVARLRSSLMEPFGMSKKPQHIEQKCGVLLEAIEGIRSLIHTESPQEASSDE